MNKEKIRIWDREFEIEINYCGYPEEEITDEQRNSLKEFLDNDANIQKSLSDVKEYAHKKSNGNIVDGGIENIFKYVMPRYLYVPKAKTQVVAIMCDYKFDMENGIAVIFENGKFKKIGVQDIIL